MQDESKRIERSLRSFDALEEAKNKLPDINNYPHNTVEIPVEIPINNETSEILVGITFRKEYGEWVKKSSRRIELP